MFQVRREDKQTLLDNERSTSFYHTVTQLLLVTSRVRRDIKMAIDFLCTQLRIPDEDDWGKLVRLLRYIRGTLNLPLILRAYRLSVIKWWVDVYFAAQPDYKGLSGAMVFMGLG